MAGKSNNNNNSKGAEMVNGGAETQYIEAKTSVWWDIENCQVPKGCDPHQIAQNISSSLLKMNYCGAISISAYGDTNRITPSVQQALSSTGITLNHVPAGVKDASDKKILVDMLFWAVDNPAPANYLLISGDRDFSNALHQLRMRRYNILLAQPQNASAPLLAAAKSVWLWTSLLAGGPPLANGESPPFVSNNNVSSTDMKSPCSEPMHVNQSLDTGGNNSSGNQKFVCNGKSGDNKYKGKHTRKNPTQPNMSRASSAPAGIQEIKNSNGSSQPVYVQAKSSKEAPHEFFGGNTAPNFFSPNPNPSWNSGNNFPNNCQPQYTQPFRPSNIPLQPNYQPQYPQPSRPNNSHPLPDFSQGHQYPPNHTQGYRPLLPRPDGSLFTSAPLVNVPDFKKLSISEYPNGVQYPPNFQQRNGGEFRPNSFSAPLTLPNMSAPQNLHTSHSGPPFYPDNQNGRCAPRGPDFPKNSNDSQNGGYPLSRGSEYPISSSFSMSTSSVPVWGAPGCPKPSDYIQGLIGIVILALDTLKNEKMLPTEANISDCIRYSLKHQHADAKMALESAIEHQMVVKQYLGSNVLYTRKNEKVWDCVNQMEHKLFPKALWTGVQNFLSSPSGRAAIVASKCRYEAAITLKDSCLKDPVLGEVLNILNLVITHKRWINVHSSGWRPISIVLPEGNVEIVGKTST